MESERIELQKSLVNEISKGMGQLKQVKVSCPEQEKVVQRMVSSYEEALFILTGGAPLEQCQSVITSSPNPPPSSPSARKRRRLTVNTIDDGYSWKKYGEKAIVNSKHQRAYYRCTHAYDSGCGAKKHVERSENDPTTFDVTYTGVHTCAKSMATSASSSMGHVGLVESMASNTGHIGLDQEYLKTPLMDLNEMADTSEFLDIGDVQLGSNDKTLKRPRLVWTPQLHKRFVDAVAHLGIKNAVPKTIMQLMSVNGLTRENVANHLQKYRLYLKRMQGISSNGGGANSPAALSASGMDAATDHLFASSPVPSHFLHEGRGSSDHFLPFVPVAAMQQQFRHFGSSPPNGQFEHPFIRQPQPQRMGTPLHSSNGAAPAATPSAYSDDLVPANATNGRKILTLFPTGDD